MDISNSQYIQSPEVDRKARTTHARCDMDLPPSFPPVCVHCVCPIWEQRSPSQVIESISRYHQLSKERYKPWSQHQWNKAYLLCNEAGSKARPPCQRQVQQHQQDYVPRNRILLQKAPTFVRHHLGNTNCSHYTTNAHGNSLWGQLPGRCGRILD